VGVVFAASSLRYKYISYDLNWIQAPLLGFIGLFPILFLFSFYDLLDFSHNNLAVLLLYFPHLAKFLTFTFSRHQVKAKEMSPLSQFPMEIKTLLILCKKTETFVHDKAS